MMSPAVPRRGQLVLVDETAEAATTGGYRGAQALVPILIGLSLPIVLFTLFDPRALGNARLVLHMIMMAIALVAATLFVLSITNPGTVVLASFDTVRRTVELVRSGTYANNVLTIPFDRVASIRIDTVYDDDGYYQRHGVLQLISGDTHRLPAGTTDADIREIRAATGLR